MEKEQVEERERGLISSSLVVHYINSQRSASTRLPSLPARVIDVLLFGFY